MAAAVERFWASRQLRRASYSFRVRALSRIPSAGGLGGAVQGGNLRPQRKEQPLVLGGRQFQLILVGSGACMFDPFLHVAERDQPYLGLHVGVEVIPDGG